MLKWTSLGSIGFLFVMVLVASGCGRQKEEVPVVVKKEIITKAVAVLHPTEESNVHGIVTFTKQGMTVNVVADVEGLSLGNHGFHIHEYGDCTALDASSAGGHFNPDSTQHGGPEAQIRHVGDLGNLTADADGKAHYVLNDSELAFSGPHSIIGRAVIVHANPDDFQSQPSGNAGPRVACGVIGIARP